MQHINFRSDYVFDFVILLATFYVYTCKLSSVNPALNVFIKQPQRRYEFEKYTSFINMEHHTFVNNWRLYLPVLENQNWFQIARYPYSTSKLSRSCSVYTMNLKVYAFIIID